MKFSFAELGETLQKFCSPGSPEYNGELHRRLYSLRPDWFGGEGALSPPEFADGVMLECEGRKVWEVCRERLSDGQCREVLDLAFGGAFHQYNPHEDYIEGRYESILVSWLWAALQKVSGCRVERDRGCATSSSGSGEPSPDELALLGILEELDNEEEEKKA